jgi:pyruvate-formate lyase
MKPLDAIHLSDAVLQLQADAFERSQSFPLPLHEENQTHAFFDLYADLPLPERHAKAFAYALANERVTVYPGEFLQGQAYEGWNPSYYEASPQWTGFTVQDAARPRVAAALPEWDQLWGAQLPADQRPHLINEGACPGHVTWNYHWVFKHGLKLMIAKHRQAAREATDDARRMYYDGVATCLEAVVTWNQRHVDELLRLRDEATDDTLRERIQDCIDVMSQVPAGPARSFREALQSFYFIWLAWIYENPYGGNGPGRLDYFLWPYLERDLAAGAITPQQAGDLIAELFIKIDERIHMHDGNVNALVVGGVGPDGQDTTNPLTYLMLDAVEQLNVTHPSVYARLHNGCGVTFVDRCVNYLLAGGNRAQILVDEPILNALVATEGLPPGEAALYTCGGCMEINAHGMNSDLLFTYWYNVPKTLELLMTGGVDLVTDLDRLPMDASLRDFDSFEPFYEAFEREVTRVLHTKFRELDIYSEEMARHRPTYLLSSLTTGCFEAGRDQQDGGAKHSVYGGAPLGIQNAADSLFAIKTAVFDEQFVTADDLLDALATDFAGREQLLSRLRGIPKFGQDHDEANAMMNRVLQSICNIHHAYRNRHGQAIRPIIFTFTWASEMGEALGATPDGRRAGTPIGHGLTPQSLAMDKGLTAAMQSYLSLDTTAVTGGASTMWDMDSSAIDFPTMRAIVETFRRSGGMILQGNTTSVAELEAAMARPDEFGHLIVRVGGFSARFTSLSERVQREIIERRRHTFL